MQTMKNASQLGKAPDGLVMWLLLSFFQDTSSMFKLLVQSLGLSVSVLAALVNLATINVTHVMTVFEVNDDPAVRRLPCLIDRIILRWINGCWCCHLCLLYIWKYSSSKPRRKLPRISALRSCSRAFAIANTVSNGIQGNLASGSAKEPPYTTSILPCSIHCRIVSSVTPIRFAASRTLQVPSLATGLFVKSAIVLHPFVSFTLPCLFMTTIVVYTVMLFHVKCFSYQFPELAKTRGGG